MSHLRVLWLIFDPWGYRWDESVVVKQGELGTADFSDGPHSLLRLFHHQRATEVVPELTLLTTRAITERLDQGSTTHMWLFDVSAGAPYNFGK